MATMTMAAVLPAFEAVDNDESGMIDADESAALTKLLKEEHNVAFRFETVDRDRDGLINHEEFLAYDAELSERLGIV